MLQWLQSAVRVVLWPWQDKQTHICPTAFAPWVFSIGHEQCLLHLLASSRIRPLLLLSTAILSLSPFPVWCAVKTAVKHSLISPAISQWNPNEKILPTFSFSCHINADKRLQYHLWPFTGLSEHTHTHTIPITGNAFESAESGVVWRNLMTHNVASILALHGQATRCTICPLFKEEGGAWVALKPVRLQESKRMRYWVWGVHSTTHIWMNIRSLYLSYC